MSAFTTIKVPASLRDRLAERTKLRESPSLAATVEELLQLVEAQEFWAQVNARHAALTDDERAAHVADPMLANGLRNDIDDEVAAQDAW